MGQYSTAYTATDLNEGSGGVAWTSLSNGRIVDTLLASVTLTPGQAANSLDYQNFKIALAANAIITGVQVILTARKSSALNSISATGGVLVGGVPVGTTSKKSIISTSLSSIQFGADGDLFGVTTLTPAVLASSAFGFQIVVNSEAVSAGSDTPAVDGVVMTIYWNRRRGLSSCGAGQ